MSQIYNIARLKLIDRLLLAIKGYFFMSVVQTHTQHNVFKTDIEALRALAVLFVLFTHLQIMGFSGGYIGVDIFFVISGYLITKNIYNLNKGGFSYKEFYCKRIRRLFPALYATIIICLIAGFFILSFRDYMELGQSSIFSIFSLSNILFWLQDNYFGNAAIRKPLLHTWSLSVEEGFYLLYPAFLIYCLKRFNIKIILVSVILTSLIITQLLIVKYPSMVFYLTPFRIFELAIGGLLVFIDKDYIKSKFKINIVWLLSLASLFICSYIYNETTLFP